MNGFSSSIGWNLGKNKKSNHLLDPFTSTPTIGTNIKKIKQTVNIIIDIFNKCFWLIEENKIIKKIPILI